MGVSVCRVPAVGGGSLQIPRESIILFYNEYGQGQRERQIMSFVIHPSIGITDQK